MAPESSAQTELGLTRPETQLMLRCLSPGAGAVSIAAIEALLGDGIDWAWLVETAEAHAVTVLLFRRLLTLAPRYMPPEIIAAATVHGQRQAARNQALCEELLRVVAALEGAGISVLPFKGPVLAQRAYGDPALRRYRDLDFLVKEEDALAARRVLGTLGYDIRNSQSPAQDAACRRYAGQEIFFRKGGTAPVEPHWTLAPHTLALDLDYAGLWRRVTTMTLAGRRITGLTDEDLMLTVCLHGSKEQWVRLQWICDVAYLVAACPTLDWAVLLTRAAQQGCLRMVTTGLALAHELLDMPLNDCVARAIAADPTAIALAMQAADSLFRPGRCEESIYEVTKFRLLMRERWRDRARYVVRTALTPREAHFSALQLPDSLFFLYPLVKLVHDYGVMPLWSAGKRAMQRHPAAEDEPTL